MTDLRRSLSIVALCTCALVACENDPTRPDGGDRRSYGVVLNSVSASLTVFPLDEPDSSRTIALNPASTATTLATRGSIALVPLGLFPALAVVDLEGGVVLDEIPLPAGSGATGVAIVDDSLAFVANPGLNSVTPVNYRDFTALEPIAVGVYPTALLALGDRVFVIEANLESFAPAGPSTVSVIDAEALEVDADLALSGRNAAQAATDGEDLFIIHAGDFDSVNASLSVVELPLASETASHPGFGSFASEIAMLADGDVAVTSPAYGVAVFDPAGGSFVVAPGAGFGAGERNLLGLGIDPLDRVWLVDAANCASPGAALLMSASFQVVDEAEVGVCPDAIAFAEY